MVAGCSLILASCDHLSSSGEKIAVQNGAGAPSAVDMPLSQMTQYMSGGSVEVYGIDGPVGGDDMMTSGPALPTDNGGRSYGGDASVQVYPMDDGAPLYEGGVPPMMPPSGARQDYPSPFKDHEGLLPMDSSAAKVFFDHNSTAIKPEGRKTISQVAHSATGAVQVDGHASTRAESSDPVARHIVNLKTAMDRAFNVSRELMREGVPAEAITTSAYGDTRPAAEGEAASRRVDIRSGATY